MNSSHSFQISRFKSLLFSVGSGLACLFFFLFCLVSYAQADGPEVDLSLGEQDTIIVGDTAHGWLGEVTGVADFNGDGFDDLLIGSSGTNFNGAVSGAAYMILGSDTLPFSISLTITRPNLSIYGANTNDALGHSVAGGDVNGDGYADMVVGADLFGTTDRGVVYVILGHDGGLFSTPVTMNLAITSAALTIVGQSGQGRLGRSVASADINNDGFDDIIAGAYTLTPTLSTRTEAGAVYVILGNSNITSTTPTTLFLSIQPPALTIYGDDNYDRLGRSVAAGDVNGDNIPDIIASAYQADSERGKTYIFYGSQTYTTTSPITINLGITGTADITITGIDPGDQSGFYVGGGNLNNDSYDDVLIGAYQSWGWNNIVSDTGEIYVVYGASNLNGTIDLSTAADITVYGANGGDRLGRSLSAGDINADGYDDMILGAARSDPGSPARTNAGQVYVIYSGPALSSTILLSNTAASNMRILGNQGVTPVCTNEYTQDCSDEAGRAASAGDINGDGVYDIIAGAIFANNGSIVDSGAAYLVYGSPALTISLTPAANTITAGQTITYTLTASNTFGAWDVTSVGAFTISPAAKGNWVDNLYTGAISGPWTVTGTFYGLTATAKLTVERAIPATMRITPDPETIMAGQTVTYTAIVTDAFGNAWDVTNAAAFTITGGASGSWNNNVYTSNVAGSWTVTGDYQSLNDTASLTVDPLQLAFSSTAYEVAEDGNRAVITVTLSPTPLTQVSVNYGSTNGSAMAGSDYLTTSGVLTFNPGVTALTFTVLITDDLVDENNENLSLTLSNPSGAAAISTGSASLTIIDNDMMGVTVSRSGVAVEEGGPDDTYTIRLNTVPTGTVTVDFTTGSQLASIAALTFTADATALAAQTVTVAAVNDTVVEGNHSGGVISHGASGGGYNGVSIASVTAVITDNDIAYVLAANQASVAEGNTGTTVISYTITRSGDITRSSSVTFGLSGSATSGMDYTNVTPVPGVVSFISGGQVTRTITMTVVGDYVEEANESITVTLSSPTGTGSGGSGSVSGSPAGVTIVDDDAAGIVVSPTVLSVSEPSGTAVFTVRLTSQPTAAVTVPLSTSNGECSVASTAVVTSGNWSTGVSVTVSAVDDQVSDGAQVCVVQTNPASSSDSSYNTLNSDDVTVTVNDNEVRGVTVSRSGVVVEEGGPDDTYTIRLNTVPTGTVTVDFTTGSQLASIAALTFTADATALAAQTVTVAAVNDTVVEGNHSGGVISHGASGGGYNGVSIASVTAVITDNDIAYVLAANQASVAEGNTGTTVISYTITRSGDITRSSSVTFGLSGSATSGMDYTNVTPVPGVVSFISGGQVTRTITMTVVGDYVEEANESITVTLSSPTGTGSGGSGSVSGSPAGVTIVDDDAAGIVVSPTVLSVSEPSGTAVFTITLNSAPTGVVTVPLSTSNGECSVASTAVVTDGNWNTGVRVTVSAVDDQVSDGAQVCVVQTGNTASADSSYDNLNPADVNVTVSDNEVRGVTVSRSGVVVEEGGPNDTYTIRLNTIPTGTVTVDFTTGSQLASIAALTFTADATALAAQTVTVAAVNDTVVEGNHSGGVISHIASGGGYNGVSIASVTAVITDNDIAYVLAANQASVAEGNTGTTVISYTITRSGDITRTSSITFALSGTATSSEDYTNVTPAPGTVSFSAGQILRSITMLVVGDYVEEANESITVTLSSPTGTGSGGTGSVSGSPAGTTIVDNDGAGIVVSPTVLSMGEPSGSGVFTISLNSQPTGVVTVPLSTSNTECSVGSTAVLTSGNWQAGARVTVSAVDDQVSDGAQVCVVQTGMTVSADSHYNSLNPADVTVTVNDNEVRGVTVSRSGVVVEEGGPNGNYTIRLNTIPTDTVTVNFTTGSQLASITALTFAPDVTALSVQTVTVAAVNDTIVEGRHSGGVISHGASGGGYNGVSIASVTAVITDNDINYGLAANQASVAEGNSGVTVISYIITRSGDITRSSSVFFGLSGSATSGMDYTNVTPVPGVVSFSGGQVTRTITMTVVGDYVEEANESITVTLSSPTGTGSGGSGSVSGSPAGVTIVDDDAAGIVVSPTVLSVSEPSGMAVFIVRLTSQPTAAVTVTLTSTDTGECTVPASVSVNSGNWQSGVSVTVSAVDDLVDDGSQLCVVQTNPASSSDSSYNTLNPANVTVTVQDNDVAGITITPTNLSVSEPSGTAVFTVSLTSQPTAAVTVTLTSTDTGECTVPASVSVNSGNWQSGVSVTVTAQDDFIADGSQLCVVQTNPASSSDSSYNGLNPANVTVTVQDNDAPPVLSIAKTVHLTHNPAEQGEPITYTIIISNISATDAPTVTINDTLPVGVIGTNLNQTVAINAHQSLTFTLSATVANNALYGVTITNSVMYSHTFGSGQANAAFTTIADTTAPSFIPPALITPTGYIILSAKRPVFDWTDAMDTQSGVLSYTLLITSSNNSVSLQEASTTITTNYSIFTPTVDLAEGVYTWTVRAHDVAGNATDYVAPDSFIISVGVSKTYLPIILRNN